MKINRTSVPKNTPPGAYSPFDIEKIPVHIDKDNEVDDLLVQECYQAIVNVIEHKYLAPCQVMELTMVLMQTFIVNYYPIEHVAPKMFVFGASLLKSAEQFAHKTSTLNVNINSLDNIRVLQEKIKAVIDGYPINYEKLPGLSLQTSINPN